MTAAPNVRFNLANLPENVSLVRELLAGVAEAVPLVDGQLDDIKTVVSEAANNVVLHAYGGAPGPLEVEVYIDDGLIGIVVRDHGQGIRPRAPSDEPVTGIGLSVIQALTDRVEFRSADGGGTEVRMEFATPGARRPAGRAPTPPALPLEPDETASLAIAPASLAERLLSRPVSAMAARARFSIDRLSDVQMVTDALTAHAERAVTGAELRLSVAVALRSLELRVGPLEPGRAAELVGASAVGGLAPLVETLADEVSVAPYGAGERLTLRLRDERAVVGGGVDVPVGD